MQQRAGHRARHVPEKGAGLKVDGDAVAVLASLEAVHSPYWRRFIVRYGAECRKVVPAKQWLRGGVQRFNLQIPGVPGGVATTQRVLGSAGVDTVAIPAAACRPAGAEVPIDFGGVEDPKVVRKRSVQGFAQAGGAVSKGRVEAHDLSVRVNTSVGATGELNHDRFPADAQQRILQHALDCAQPRLPLGAVKFRAVVGKDQS